MRTQKILQIIRFSCSIVIDIVVEFDVGNNADGLGAVGFDVAVALAAVVVVVVVVLVDVDEVDAVESQIAEDGSRMAPKWPLDGSCALLGNLLNVFRQALRSLQGPLGGCLGAMGAFRGLFGVAWEQ